MVTGLGGALAVIGAFLAWAKVTAAPGVSVSFAGTDEAIDPISGWYALIAGVIVLLVAVAMFAQGARPWHGIVALLGGAAILLIAIIDIVNVEEGVGIGIGLWITIVGGALAVVGGIWGLRGGMRAGPAMRPPAA